MPASRSWAFGVYISEVIDRKGVRARAFCGLRDNGTRAAATAGLSGDVFQSRSPLALDDLAAEARVGGTDEILSAGYAAYLGVPLSGPKGTLAGVLSVYAWRPRDWRPEEIEALLALAGNTSAALANAELVEIGATYAVDEARWSGYFAGAFGYDDNVALCSKRLGFHVRSLGNLRGIPWYKQADHGRVLTSDQN